ncbi:MAG: TrkA C-terminal domain-containing protein, partial [Candidatus Margulisbacteria bacterium]|nr:TrkA C-terminal domain-containing protein [Candidatus Margulisiibacteriota bacterium]
LDYFDLGEDLTIVGTKALPNWVGQKLQELDLRNKYGVTVLAIRRGNENILIPAWATVVEKDDVIVLYGKEESLKQMDLDITHRT